MTKTYTVPVIDPESGYGWDEELEAESPQEAIEKVGAGVYVASTFVEEYL